MISKFLSFVFLIVFCAVSAQENKAFDSTKLKEVNDFFADDYGNFYLYKKQNFSFTKYDSLGKELGRLMMTVPFRVQSVQNPLTIFLFSENAQELKMLDQNLNEIQKIDFRQKFGFVKSAYTEDLQQIWLLDESTKRLIQYNYRQDLIINSYPMNFDFSGLIAMLIYNQQLYLIYEDWFFVYNFKGEKLEEFAIQNPRKIYRENEDILVVSKDEIKKYQFPKSLQTVSKKENSEIVDKNSTAYFELKEGKFYLYRIEK